MAKYHRNSHGDILPCRATVRPCPHSQHYESAEDAASERQRIARNMDKRENILSFSSTIGSGPAPEGLSGNSGSPIRQASENAREMFYRNGHRPCSPLGDIAVNLPYGNRILLRRETYDRLRDAEEQIGVRYYVRRYFGDNLRESSLLALNNPTEAKHFENCMQQYFSDSSVGQKKPFATLGEGLSDQYEETMQQIAEIEIMARGADNAHRRLDMDLFSKDRPGVLSLNSSYSSSALQPYDVSDSLKVHSQYDEHPHDVEINIREERPNGDSWSLNRIAEGDWFFGYTTSEGETSTRQVHTPEEARASVEEYLTKRNASANDVKAQRSFVEHLMSESEMSIGSYRKAVLGRERDAKPFSGTEGTVHDSSPQDTVIGSHRGSQASSTGDYTPRKPKNALGSLLKHFS